MIVRATLAFGLSVVLAAPVSALSCLQPDAERAFDAALASDENYIVVTGRFAFDADTLPQGINGGQTPPVAIPAVFTGQGLTFDGFTTDLAMRVTLEVSCLDPWCGSLNPDVVHLAFLRRTTGGYVLDVGPCPEWRLDEPTPETLGRIHRCLQDDGCGTAP